MSSVAPSFSKLPSTELICSFSRDMFSSVYSSIVEIVSTLITLSVELSVALTAEAAKILTKKIISIIIFLFSKMVTSKDFN